MDKEFVINQFAEALVYAFTKAEVKVLELLAESVGILDEVKSRIDENHQADMASFESLDKYINLKQGL